jgi:hypothetical protein
MHLYTILIMLSIYIVTRPHPSPTYITQFTVTMPKSRNDTKTKSRKLIITKKVDRSWYKLVNSESNVFYYRIAEEKAL